MPPRSSYATLDSVSLATFHAKWPPMPRSSRPPPPWTPCKLLVSLSLSSVSHVQCPESGSKLIHPNWPKVRLKASREFEWKWVSVSAIGAAFDIILLWSPASVPWLSSLVERESFSLLWQFVFGRAKVTAAVSAGCQSFPLKIASLTGHSVFLPDKRAAAPRGWVPWLRARVCLSGVIWQSYLCPTHFTALCVLNERGAARSELRI